MPKRPLEGIKVADFSWFGAGPIAGNTLSQFGAEVVRVESETKVDGLRSVHPFALNADGAFKTGYNVSGYFNNFNTGKLGISLNLNVEKGQEIGYRLIEWADFFLTNFTPRVIEKWNLSYPQISRVNPRIIAAYAPMQGMEGPHKDFLGFGAVLTPVTGLSEMSGFPHRPPFGVGTNYPDYVINPGHTATAMLAALRYRNRTGKGQCIELPQLESVVNTLGTAVVERLVNGTNPSRNGNRSNWCSPHGAFRCQDDPESVDSPDRWVVMACRDESEWAKAAEVLGHPEAATDDRFANLAARKSNEDELEQLINSWTKEWKANDLCYALQAAGIPAGVVQHAQDLLDRDPHIKARGYYQYVDHPEAGREAHDGPAAVLSKTPGYVSGPAPLMGEHTMEVCERILGLNMDEVADLLAEGVLI